MQTGMFHTHMFFVMQMVMPTPHVLFFVDRRSGIINTSYFSFRQLACQPWYFCRLANWHVQHWLFSRHKNCHARPSFFSPCELACPPPHIQLFFGFPTGHAHTQLFCNRQMSMLIANYFPPCECACSIIQLLFLWRNRHGRPINGCMVAFLIPSTPPPPNPPSQLPPPQRHTKCSSKVTFFVG